MIVTYGTDLFREQNRVLVIPTNCVGAQGAGLAKVAALKWPTWSAWYKSECQAHHVSPGQVKAYCGEASQHRPQLPILVSMATKDHWRDPSRLEWIERGLHSLEALLTMARQGSALDVLHGRGLLKQGTRVGIPAVGCGRGGVDYLQVKPLIEDCAERLSAMDYHVHLYPPQ